MTLYLSLLLALLLDRVIGWPDWLHRRISHPVVWIGALIQLCDARLNQPSWRPITRRMTGILTLLLVLGVVTFSSLAVAWMLPDGIAGIVLTALLAWPFLATKSLHDHVLAVARALAIGDLDGARAAVAKIVGRGTDQMDGPAIARASLESLGENTSDGVIAPLFWGAVFGLPGLIIYKAINTLDSMVGYRNQTYKDFGWASARLDDLVNIVPARLTAMLFAGLWRRKKRAFQIMWRDARHHRSPNAGWPEAALAASLEVRLSGPRLYDDKTSDDHWVNAEARDPTAQDIGAGLTLFNRLLLAAGLLLICAAAAQ